MRKIKDCYEYIEGDFDKKDIPSGYFFISDIDIELYKGFLYLNINKKKNQLFLSSSESEISCFHRRIKPDKEVK